MMKKIIQETLAAGHAASIEALMHCAEEIKNRGNIFMVKLDGERKVEEGQYTVVTCPAGSKDPTLDLIRADEHSLKQALIKVLKAYMKKGMPYPEFVT